MEFFLPSKQSTQFRIMFFYWHIIYLVCPCVHLRVFVLFVVSSYLVCTCLQLFVLLCFLDCLSQAPTHVRCWSVGPSHIFGFPFCHSLWTVTEGPPRLVTFETFNQSDKKTTKSKTNTTTMTSTSHDVNLCEIVVI